MDKTFNNRLLQAYMSVVKTNAERLLDSNIADFIYLKFLDEYYSLLSETGKLKPNNCLVLKTPVRIPDYGKTITNLFMGMEISCGYAEGGSDEVSNLSFFSIRKIVESILSQMEC